MENARHGHSPHEANFVWWGRLTKWICMVRSPHHTWGRLMTWNRPHEILLRQTHDTILWTKTYFKIAIASELLRFAIYHTELVKNVTNFILKFLIWMLQIQTVLRKFNCLTGSLKCCTNIQKWNSRMHVRQYLSF